MEVTPHDIAAARELNGAAARKAPAQQPAPGTPAGTQILICLGLMAVAVWAVSSAIYLPLDLSGADHDAAYWLGAIGWGLLIGLPGGLGLSLTLLGHRAGIAPSAAALALAVLLVTQASASPEKFITNMGGLVARVMGG